MPDITEKQANRYIRRGRGRGWKNFIWWLFGFLSSLVILGSAGAIAICVIPIRTYIGGREDIVDDEIANGSILNLVLHYRDYQLGDLPILANMIRQIMESRELDKYLLIDYDALNTISYETFASNSFNIMDYVTITATVDNLGFSSNLGVLADIDAFTNWEVVPDDKPEAGSDFDPRIYYYEVNYDGTPKNAKAPNEAIKVDIVEAKGKYFKRAYNDDKTLAEGATRPFYYPALFNIPLLDMLEIVQPRIMACSALNLIEGLIGQELEEDALLYKILDGQTVGDLATMSAESVTETIYLIDVLPLKRDTETQKGNEILYRVLCAVKHLEIDDEDPEKTLEVQSAKLKISDLSEELDTESIRLADIIDPDEQKDVFDMIVAGVNREGATADNVTVGDLMNNFDTNAIKLAAVIKPDATNEDGDLINKALYDILIGATGVQENMTPEERAEYDAMADEDERFDYLANKITIGHLSGMNTDAIHLSTVLNDANEDVKKILTNAAKPADWDEMYPGSEYTFEDITVGDLKDLKTDKILLESVVDPYETDDEGNYKNKQLYDILIDATKAESKLTAEQQAEYDALTENDAKLRYLTEDRFFNKLSNAEKEEYKALTTTDEKVAYLEGKLYTGLTAKQQEAYDGLTIRDAQSDYLYGIIKIGDLSDGIDTKNIRLATVLTDAEDDLKEVLTDSAKPADWDLNHPGVPFTFEDVTVADLSSFSTNDIRLVTVIDPDARDSENNLVNKSLYDILIDATNVEIEYSDLNEEEREQYNLIKDAAILAFLATVAASSYDELTPAQKEACDAYVKEQTDAYIASISFAERKGIDIQYDDLSDEEKAEYNALATDGEKEAYLAKKSADEARYVMLRDKITIGALNEGISTDEIHLSTVLNNPTDSVKNILTDAAKPADWDVTHPGVEFTFDQITVGDLSDFNTDAIHLSTVLDPNEEDNHNLFDILIDATHTVIDEEYLTDEEKVAYNAIKEAEINTYLSEVSAPDYDSLTDEQKQECDARVLEKTQEYIDTLSFAERRGVVVTYDDLTLAEKDEYDALATDAEKEAYLAAKAEDKARYEILCEKIIIKDLNGIDTDSILLDRVLPYDGKDGGPDNHDTYDILLSAINFGRATPLLYYQLTVGDLAGLDTGNIQLVSVLDPVDSADLYDVLLSALKGHYIYEEDEHGNRVDDSLIENAEDLRLRHLGELETSDIKLTAVLPLVEDENDPDYNVDLYSIICAGLGLEVDDSDPNKTLAVQAETITVGDLNHFNTGTIRLKDVLDPEERDEITNELLNKSLYNILIDITRQHIAYEDLDPAEQADCDLAVDAALAAYLANKGVASYDDLDVLEQAECDQAMEDAKEEFLLAYDDYAGKLGITFTTADLDIFEIDEYNALATPAEKEAYLAKKAEEFAKIKYLSRDITIDSLKGLDTDNLHLATVIDPNADENQSLYDILTDITSLSKEEIKLSDLSGLDTDKLHLATVIDPNDPANEDLYNILVETTKPATWNEAVDGPYNADAITIEMLSNLDTDKLRLATVLEPDDLGNKKLYDILVDATTDYSYADLSDEQKATYDALTLADAQRYYILEKVYETLTDPQIEDYLSADDRDAYLYSVVYEMLSPAEKAYCDTLDAANKESYLILYFYTNVLTIDEQDRYDTLTVEYAQTRYLNQCASNSLTLSDLKGLDTDNLHLATVLDPTDPANDSLYNILVETTKPVDWDIANPTNPYSAEDITIVMLSNLDTDELHLSTVLDPADPANDSLYNILVETTKPATWNDAIDGPYDAYVITIANLSGLDTDKLHLSTVIDADDIGNKKLYDILVDATTDYSYVDLSDEQKAVYDALTLADAQRYYIVEKVYAALVGPQLDEYLDADDRNAYLYGVIYDQMSPAEQAYCDTLNAADKEAYLNAFYYNSALTVEERARYDALTVEYARSRYLNKCASDSLTLSDLKGLDTDNLHLATVLDPDDPANEDLYNILLETTKPDTWNEMIDGPYTAEKITIDNLSGLQTSKLHLSTVLDPSGNEDLYDILIDLTGGTKTADEITIDDLGGLDTTELHLSTVLDPADPSNNTLYNILIETTKPDTWNEAADGPYDASKITIARLSDLDTDKLRLATVIDPAERDANNVLVNKTLYDILLDVKNIELTRDDLTASEQAYYDSLSAGDKAKYLRDYDYTTRKDNVVTEADLTAEEHLVYDALSAGDKADYLTAKTNELCKLVFLADKLTIDILKGIDTSNLHLATVLDPHDAGNKTLYNILIDATDTIASLSPIEQAEYAALMTEEERYDYLSSRVSISGLTGFEPTKIHLKNIIELNADSASLYTILTEACTTDPANPLTPETITVGNIAGSDFDIGNVKLSNVLDGDSTDVQGNAFLKSLVTSEVKLRDLGTAINEISLYEAYGDKVFTKDPLQTVNTADKYVKTTVAGKVVYTYSATAADPTDGNNVYYISNTSSIWLLFCYDYEAADVNATNGRIEKFIQGSAKFEDLVDGTITGLFTSTTIYNLIASGIMIDPGYGESITSKSIDQILDIINNNPIILGYL